jgi:hypothetical protein
MINELNNEFDLENFQRLFCENEPVGSPDIYSILIKELLLTGYCEN